MTIQTVMADGIATVSTPYYVFTLNLRTPHWTLAPGDGSPALLTGDGIILLLSPQFADGALGLTDVTAAFLTPVPGDALRRLRLTAAVTAPFPGEFWNEIDFLEDRVIVNAGYRLDQPHGLAYWQIAPPGSGLQADTVHAYLGVHGNLDTINGTVWPASEVELSTASHNWMYAGSVPRVILRREHGCLGIGGTAVAHDFGLELKSRDGIIAHFRFNCGGDQAPQPVAAGEAVRSPRLQFLMTPPLPDDEVHAAFTQTMIADGIVPPKQYRPEDRAWRRPWYCTWADQMGISDAAMTQDQAGKRSYQAIKDVLTQEMVLKVARFIREQKLNIGTIIIDDGWQDFRGDWNLDTAKFPNMRGLVDELHAMEFRVALWWAPFAVEEQAAVLRRPGFTVGPCPRYGQIDMDFTKQIVRDWAAAKWETWFSKGAQGWDIDGLKLDFLVDQIYASTHHAEPEFRGEERLWRELFALLDQTIRRHRNSAGLLHVPFNPHCAPFCAAVHCEERFDQNLGYLTLRPELCHALIPGTWYAPHFNYNPRIVPDFIRAVKRAGGIVQVGKLLSPEVTPEILGQIRDLLKDAT